MRDFLSKYLPLGSYTPKHVLGYDHRGDWLIPVCMAACFLAVWIPLFLAVLRSGR